MMKKVLSCFLAVMLFLTCIPTAMAVDNARDFFFELSVDGSDKKEVQPGDIILLHDIYPSSVEAALQIVDALEAEGYWFVTVEELLELNGIQPQAGAMYRSGRA